MSHLTQVILETTEVQCFPVSRSGNLQSCFLCLFFPAKNKANKKIVPQNGTNTFCQENLWFLSYHPTNRPLMHIQASLSGNFLVKSVSFSFSARPNESFMFPYLVLQVIRFQDSILLIVQYKHLKSCSGDIIFQNLILHIRSCGTSFITESG